MDLKEKFEIHKNSLSIEIKIYSNKTLLLRLSQKETKEKLILN